MFCGLEEHTRLRKKKKEKKLIMAQSELKLVMQTLTHEPLPFSHTFGLNTFCHCNAVSWAVYWLVRSAVDPPHLGLIRAWVVYTVIQYAGTWKETYIAIFFCLQT